MSEYLTESNSLGADVKDELELSNYATKGVLKMPQVLIHWILLKRLI